MVVSMACIESLLHSLASEYEVIIGNLRDSSSSPRKEQFKLLPCNLSFNSLFRGSLDGNVIRRCVTFQTGGDVIQEGVLEDNL